MKINGWNKLSPGMRRRLLLAMSDQITKETTTLQQDAASLSKLLVLPNDTVDQLRGWADAGEAMKEELRTMYEKELLL